VFWAVSEPVTHYADPPLGLARPETPDAASLALQTAFFHWGLHPWAIYAVVGLAVAYFSYRRGMTNLQVSTVFRPLLGDLVDGPVGKAIDVIAIVATLFGVAVSLGLGTLQIDAGLSEAFGLPSGIALQLIVIAITAIAYMFSASTPINKGVNILSQTSMYVAFALLAYFIVVGPTLLQLNAFTQETGVYLANLVPQSFNMAAFEPQEATWLADWTIFFWATWIAWAPYVGVFIARISRGRTIREFILGVMIAPTIFSMILTNGAISSAAGTSEALGLFAYLQQNPLFLVTSVLMIFLVWIFFVAGADAGTIVLGSMSAGGVMNPKRLIKLTWGAIMGALAAILLLTGGLDALQNGAILAATPFAILMCLMCWCLYKTIRRDYREEREQVREIMAHDQNVEKRQMQEIMRRHEAGEPVGPATSNSRK
jgi:glycine betaine transporter